MSEENQMPVIRTADEIYQELIKTDGNLKRIDKEIEESGSRNGEFSERLESLVRERRLAEHMMYKQAESVAELTIRIYDTMAMIKQTPDLIEVRHKRKKHLRFLRLKAEDMHRDEESKCRRDYHLRRMGDKVVPPPPP